MTVRDGLLALLDNGPRHGYQLKTEFEAATGGAWSLNVGQVYTTLERLQRDGLVAIDDGDSQVSSAGGRDQKRYALTAEGREELGEWWDAVPAEDPPTRDELQLKILMAIERGRDHALDVITHQRTALTRVLQERRRKGRATPGRARHSGSGEVAAELVTDALLVRAEADLRWLDLCEGRLAQLANGAEAGTRPHSKKRSS